MARHRAGSVQVLKGAVYARVVYVDHEGQLHQMKRRARNRPKADKLVATLCDDLRKQGIENPKGSILVEKPNIYARVTYVGSDGKRAQKRRRAESRTHAKDLIDDLLKELKEHGSESLESDKMTFDQLAKKYKASELVPAVYADGHKIQGRRSLATPVGVLKTLADWFGSRKVRTITHSDILAYRLARLQQKTIRGTKRSVAAVNRELEQLRGIFNFAKRQGWLQKSPFESGGKPLIIKSAEKERERILSKSEEQALLAQCVDRREHLRPLIITALDTAMRQGELFKLQWSDVDFNTGEIHIRATTTKTLSERVVNMTTRVSAELEGLWKKSTEDPEASVFGIKSNVKRAFTGARDDAKIKGFRFHDLRHTAATRMIESGEPMEQVMKVTGHAQMKTFLRYVNVDERRTRQIASSLEQYNAKMEAEIAETSAVN